MSAEAISFNWKCKHTWRRSAKNTAWCLLGCSIGDLLAHLKLNHNCLVKGIEPSSLACKHAYENYGLSLINTTYDKSSKNFN